MIKVKKFMLIIKWSYRSPPFPPNYVDHEPRMLSYFEHAILSLSLSLANLSKGGGHYTIHRGKPTGKLKIKARHGYSCSYSYIPNPRHFHPQESKL